jgi:hypothetical protein
MKKLQLVAQTPRAGDLNHRLLVAADSNLSESEVAQLLDEAARNPQGENYLAVSAEKIKQVKSHRTGTEILVLVGVDVKRLSDGQRQQIMAQLRQQLDELASLVTSTIDWSQEKHLLIRREELAKWEEAFQGLPEKKTPSRPKKPVERFWLMGAVVVVVLIGIFWLGWWMISGTSSPLPNPPIKEGKPSQAQKKEPVDPAAMEQTKKLMAVFAAFQAFAECIKPLKKNPYVNSQNSYYYNVITDLFGKKQNISNKDVKSLEKFFDNKGSENKVIDETLRVKVFTTLCQLTDDNVVRVKFVKKTGEPFDLCIPAPPNLCNKLDYNQPKNVAKALFELRNKIKNDCGEK